MSMSPARSREISRGATALGRGGSCVGDHTRHFRLRDSGEMEGAVLGEDLIQQHTKRVDVGGGCNGFGANLLGTGIVGRKQAIRGNSGIGVSGRIVIEQLGNAEVKQLRHAIFRDENVFRLEIAMDDQIAMRVFDRAADLHE